MVVCKAYRLGSQVVKAVDLVVGRILLAVMWASNIYLSTSIQSLVHAVFITMTLTNDDADANLLQNYFLLSTTRPTYEQ